MFKSLVSLNLEKYTWRKQESSPFSRQMSELLGAWGGRLDSASVASVSFLGFLFSLDAFLHCLVVKRITSVSAVLAHAQVLLIAAFVSFLFSVFITVSAEIHSLSISFLGPRTFLRNDVMSFLLLTISH